MDPNAVTPFVREVSHRVSSPGQLLGGHPHASGIVRFHRAKGADDDDDEVEVMSSRPNAELMAAGAGVSHQRRPLSAPSTQDKTESLRPVGFAFGLTGQQAPPPSGWEGGMPTGLQPTDGRNPIGKRRSSSGGFLDNMSKAGYSKVLPQAGPGQTSNAVQHIPASVEMERVLINGQRPMQKVSSSDSLGGNGQWPRPGGSG